MLEWFLETDRELLLFLNGLGSPYLDQFMIWMSDKYIWFPLYLYLIYRMVAHHGRKFYEPLLALLLVIVITDQTTSSFMKPFFERLRPCKDPALDGLIQMINKCRGNFGFASGHAANSFGLAAFFYLKEKSTLGLVLVIWAAVVAYSRIYLGVHYPGDVLVGTALGWLAAFLVLKIYYLLTATKD